MATTVETSKRERDQVCNRGRRQNKGGEGEAGSEFWSRLRPPSPPPLLPPDLLTKEGAENESKIRPRFTTSTTYVCVGT